MYTVSQFKKLGDKKYSYIGDWRVNTIEEAISDILTCKISGKGCFFAIENQNGTVVDVIHM